MWRGGAEMKNEQHSFPREFSFFFYTKQEQSKFMYLHVGFSVQFECNNCTGSWKPRKWWREEQMPLSRFEPRPLSLDSILTEFCRPRCKQTDGLGVEADIGRLHTATGLVREGVTASQISAEKRGGEKWSGTKDLPLRDPPCTRRLIRYLATFSRVSAWARVSALFIVPTDEPRQH